MCAYLIPLVTWILNALSLCENACLMRWERGILGIISPIFPPQLTCCHALRVHVYPYCKLPRPPHPALKFLSMQLLTPCMVYMFYTYPRVMRLILIYTVHVCQFCHSIIMFGSLLHLATLWRTYEVAGKVNHQHKAERRVVPEHLDVRATRNWKDHVC